MTTGLQLALLGGGFLGLGIVLLIARLMPAEPDLAEALLRLTAVRGRANAIGPVTTAKGKERIGVWAIKALPPAIWTRTPTRELALLRIPLAKFYGVAADHLVVVHDELDIAFDTLRVKFGGGDNGHNGLRSIRSSLSTGDFYRVRVGIGRPPGRQDPADFVLSNYSAAERKVLPFQVDTAADAVECLVDRGLAETQQRFNR